MQNVHYWNLTEADESVHLVHFCQQIWNFADLDSLALSKSKFQSFKVHALEPATIRLLHVSGKMMLTELDNECLKGEVMLVLKNKN